MATVAEVLRFQLLGTGKKGVSLFQSEPRCFFRGGGFHAKEFRHFYAEEHPGTVLVGPIRGSMEGLEIVRVEDVVFPEDEFPPDDPE